VRKIFVWVALLVLMAVPVYALDFSITLDGGSAADRDFGTWGTGNMSAGPPLGVFVHNTGNQPTGPLVAAFDYGIGFGKWDTEISCIPPGGFALIIVFRTLSSTAGTFADTLTIAPAPDNPNPLAPQTLDFIIRFVATAIWEPTMLRIDGTILRWFNEAGNLAQGFRLYVDGEPIRYIPFGYTNFDLATLGLAPGTHQIKIQALGDGADLHDSGLSRPVAFHVEECDFGSVPLTGVADVSTSLFVMLALAAISAILWKVALINLKTQKKENELCS